MRKQYLSLGRMPKEAAPDTHFAAGEWCFLGADSTFPNWMSDFEIAEKRLSDMQDVEVCRRLIGWGFSCLAEYAQARNLQLEKPLSPYVWELLLGKWLMTVLPFLGKAYITAEQLTGKYGEESLTVLVPPSPDKKWASLAELEKGIRTVEGFGWLLGRVVEQVAPARWVLLDAGQTQHHPAAAVSTQSAPIQKRPFIRRKLSFAYRCFHRLQAGLDRSLSRALRKLPVPEVPFGSHMQRLLLSVVLSCNRRKPQARQHPLIADKFAGSSEDYPEWMAALLWEMLPQELNSLEQKVRPYSGLLRHCVAGPRYFRDTASTLYYAGMAVTGVALWQIQHSPLEFCIPGHSFARIEELNHAGFFNWGTARLACPSVAAPPLRYTKQLGRHVARNENIHYVVDTLRPLALVNGFSVWQSIREKRRNLETFHAALPTSLRDKMVLRHYPGAGLDAFSSENWGLAKTIPASGGDHLSAMSSAKVVVTDYIASSLGQALMLNTPCIWIWQPGDYAYEPDAGVLFFSFRKAGILHPTPADAASFLAEVWDNLDIWWESEEVRSARDLYLRRDYDINKKSPLAKWAAELWRL